MQPTTLILWLPVGDSTLPSIPDDFVVSSVTSMHIGPHFSPRGLSSVPFANLLDFARGFPRVRSLQMRSVVLNPDAYPGSPTLLPRFALLDSLNISPGFAPLSDKAPLTVTLLLLFPHMPRLRSLTTSMPVVLPQSDGERGASYPDLPLKLKRFVCLGGISAAACAHIISHSSSSLDELKINFGMVGADADDAHLVAALAQAAPRLRSLRVLDRRRRGVHALRSVSYSFTRLETLRIEAPLALADALALLDGGGVSTLRTLGLWCTRDRCPLTTVELFASLPRVPLLRSLALRGFDWVDGDEDRCALLALCSARRIQCSITD